MNDDMNRQQDPEERAFTGGADMPPRQPEQPAEENGELLRESGGESEGDGRKKGELKDEDFPTLPGYGG